MRECQLANVHQAWAFQVADHLVIAVDVELPSRGFDVEIVLGPEDVEPPSFDVLRCARPGFWPPAIERRREAQVLREGSGRETITVKGEAGSVQVPVQDLLEVAPGVAARSGPFPPDGGEDGGAEAIGMSGNLSFDEAFADALSKLPGDMASFPDELTTVQVTGVSGWFGGIAGFHHLVVRVRG